MKRLKKTLTLLLPMFGIIACQSAAEHGVTNKNTADNIWPVIESEVIADPDIEHRVKAVLATMTLEQKVAQMMQPEIRDITVEDMRKYGFGSYLNGGGSFPKNNKHSTPADWIDLAEAMYQASIDDSIDGSTIPTMWGTDAVHGHNNVIGATLFPHNIGLGAANNPELIEKIAQITATEVMVTGIDWVFAPTVATVRDDRWGRTYEGYSEDPDIVRSYANAIVKGLQGHANKDFLADNRVISTVKHFIGDGGTVKGDDQGNNIDSEQVLFDIHAQGYVGGLTAGAQSVMASFNSWHGKKIHGSSYLLTDVLKTRMGFDGFVVGDWNGHGQIAGCTNDNCPQAANAGLDMYMVPTQAWKGLMKNTIEQVKQGIIPLARINDAVTRILRVKFRAGLFDKPSPAKRPLSGKTELIGAEAHRKVARQAVRESLVLLKNKNNLLPLQPTQRILVAGDAADNIGKQSGGWTITWQGTNNANADFPGGSSILDGLVAQVEQAGGQIEFNENGEYRTKPDVAIVVYGEEPYAEGHGDRANLAYQRGNKRDLLLLKKLKAQNIPVVSVFISGRPMWVNPELNASDAFVAAWLPGSEGKAVAEVLLKDKHGAIQHDFVGKLSFSWPKTANQIVNIGDDNYSPLLPYGFGLRYGEKNTLSDELNETATTEVEQLNTLSLFNGQVSAPWQLQIISGEKGKVIASSAESIGALNYRTIDRFVQEDAIKITSTSNTNSGLLLMSSNGFREDLSSYLEAGFALSLSVKTTPALPENLRLTMSCESIGDAAGSCSGGVNLDATIKNLGPEKWHDIAIPLTCFATKGVAFDQVVIPFQLTAQRLNELNLSNIRLSALAQDSVVVNCQ